MATNEGNLNTDNGNETEKDSSDENDHDKTNTCAPTLNTSDDCSVVNELSSFITLEDNQCVTIRIPVFFCIIVPFMCIMMGIVITFIVLIARGPAPAIERELYEIEQKFGQDAVDVFKGHDLNCDDYISAFEFRQLIPHIEDIKSLASQVKPVENYPAYTPSKGEEVMIVHANFSALSLKPILTMDDLLSLDLPELGSKVMQLYLRYARYYFMPLITGQRTLYGLESWTEPNRKHEVFGVSEFKALLPDDMEELEVGLPYRILGSGGGCDSASQRKDNSRKFLPSMPQGDREKLLFRLMAMMHPRPFVNMRFHPRGTVACVQAFNDKYLHIVFRMHAEFQLSEAPANPFWFTPAQFLGDLVISRDGSHVHYFHMEVPNERKLNVDMEWMEEASESHTSMEVDIGYLPLMEWTMGGDSHLPLPDQSIRPDLSLAQAPDSMEWKEEIPREETLRLLEVEFFEFKKVTYHNLTRAVQLSKAEHKPLHAIFLWGALDDQSC